MLRPSEVLVDLQFLTGNVHICILASISNLQINLFIKKLILCFSLSVMDYRFCSLIYRLRHNLWLSNNVINNLSKIYLQTFVYFENLGRIITFVERFESFIRNDVLVLIEPIAVSEKWKSRSKGINLPYGKHVLLVGEMQRRCFP